MVSHVDREVNSVSLPSPTSFHKALVDNVSDGNIHDLKDFLRRPVVVKTGDWTSSQVANAEIDNVQIPLDVLNVGKVMAQKVSGFLGFRADVVLRLQVNTNRFQQGRLMMTYFPMAYISQCKHYTVQKSLMMRTQLPRVDFDAATDSEVILEVPYISPTMAFNTTDGSGKVGHVGLIVYDPLNAASGELSAEYSIWAHFENVELMYPTITNTSILPQSGKGRGRRMRVGDKEATEIEADSTGFISGSLMKVSKASAIMGEIPLFSSICAPASWAASVAARAAMALGFSKPLTSNQITPVIQRPWIRGPNSTGLDSSYNLGAFEDNHIEHIDGFAGQSVDEMALAYPLSIPTWISTTPWTDTAVTYTQLAAFDVRPAGGPYSFTDSNSVTFNSPMSYFSNLFQYYRGSIKFKFKFVKTEFHSGRLLLAFAPWSTSGPGVLSATNLSYLHREIVDLRTTNEVEFTCPWASTVPYLNVGTSYGTLYLIVLNELRHPDTVLSSINILTEVSCAPDFEFAVLKPPTVVPVLYGTSLLAQTGNERGRKMRIVPQVGEVSEGQQIKTASAQPSFGGIGGSNVTSDLNMSARACIGERILSLRQILKRGTKYGQSNGGASAGSQYKLSPWYSKVTLRNDTSSAWIAPISADGITTIADYYDYIVGCYAFFRGSIRIKFQMTDTTVDATGRLAYDTTTTPATATFTTATLVLRNGFSGVPWDNTSSPHPEVQIPYFNKTHMSVTGTDCTVPTALNKNYTADTTYRPQIALVSNVTASNGHSSTIYRSVGDDFSCGFWTGALCTTPYAASVTNTGNVNAP